jgi:hypothetical protein
MSKVINFNTCLTVKESELQQKQRTSFLRRAGHPGSYGKISCSPAVVMQENSPQASLYELYRRGKITPRKNNRTMGVLIQEKMVPHNKRHINKNAYSNRAKDYLRSYLNDEFTTVESQNIPLAKSRENLSVDQEKQVKEYIDKQSRLFQKNKQDLIRIYDGKYILFEDGAVLDTGNSRAELAMRAYQKHGMKPLFIEKVTSATEIIPSVWTPFSTV